MDSIPVRRSLKCMPAAMAIAMAFFSAAGAHELSLQECREGADYIRNAALSRDGGMTEAAFMGIFDNDMEIISRVPSSLRWFVQDKEDEHFLRSALEEVFRRPQPAQHHAENFAKACLLRSGEQGMNGKMRT